MCLVWGTTWIVLKTSLVEGTPPIYGVGLRFLLAGAVLWIIFFLKHESLPMTKRAWYIYLQFAIFNFTIAYALTYWGTQYIYSSVASIIWAGFPLVVGALAHFQLPDERLTLYRIISILLGTVGVVIIVSQGQHLGGERVFIGIPVVVLAVLSSAWPNVHLKKYHDEVNTIQLNAVSQTLAAIALLLLSLILEPNQPMVWSPYNIFAIAYLAIPGSVVTWMIYVWLFSHLSMGQISYVAFFPPLIATIIGWIFLQEVLTLPAIFGSLLVISGAVLINLKR